MPIDVALWLGIGLFAILNFFVYRTSHRGRDESHNSSRRKEFFYPQRVLKRPFSQKPAEPSETWPPKRRAA